MKEIPPWTVQDVLEGRSYHRCDRKGRVRRPWGNEPLTCEACNQAWSDERLLKFRDQDVVDRFLLRIPPPSETSGSLVWVEDPVSHRRHTTLVRAPRPDSEKVKV